MHRACLDARVTSSGQRGDCIVKLDDTSRGLQGGEPRVAEGHRGVAPRQRKHLADFSAYLLS